MNKISKELIENYRKFVLPFVSNRLYKTNFEGQGETDKAEFERDFNEILDLAISALNPAGDLISRAVLKNELNSRPFPQDYATTLLLGVFNELIDAAPAVEVRPQGESIIKCQDCKYRVKEWREDERMKENGYWVYGCEHFGDMMGYWGFGGNDNEFCSDAEQKGGAD